MNQPGILVIGSANVDLVTRVARCPRPGETLLGTSFEVIPGGKGANQAVAAARLGANCRFVGCVGDDAFGVMQHRTLSEAGVDVTHLKVHPEQPTGTAVIFVAAQGENTIVVTPSANFGITPEDIQKEEALFRECDAVLLQLEIPLETVEAALDLARVHNKLSILDAGPARKLPGAILAKADIVSPNETEIEAITGTCAVTIEDARRAATDLIGMGAREVVLKLGAKGSLYMGEDWFHMPAFQVEAIDTVAAGDAFTAALAVAWRTAPHKRDAVRYASAAGALAATVEGAQPSMPTREHVEAFLAEH